VPFTDERLPMKDWPARKPSTPFGSMPVLTVEGHGQFGQSNTILRLIGRQHALHPRDDFEAARHEAIMESVEEIMGLEPKPGRRFGGNDSRYIAPDVFVYKLGNEYTVVLNEDGIPRLRVNGLYRSLLRTAGSGDEAKQYVEQKLRSALWLIKSVDQRQRTLRKVTPSIVKFQRDFLDRGLSYLRPLSLRDVGEDIGMHESTISRVTTNKYVETPQGLFELKFFFHSGIASGDGEMVSSVSVKKMIQDLLANEDPAKPLSDQEVAQILKGRGLTIARRTVAKYREELGILPSHQRRLAPKRR
jgi:RNA polymerase sigma-54 factor